MTFLFPEFFWAFLALSLPIIIHLFNFRRYKTFYFSNTRLLREIEQKNRTVKQLRNWIILLSRLLFLTFLILAFAQPVLPDSPAAKSTELHLSIYIDNSYSMTIEGENGPLLNEARQEAVQFLQQLPSTAQVQIISNAFAPQEQRFYPPSLAIELVDQIESHPAYRRWEEIEQRIEQALEQAQDNKVGQHRVLIYSDLQASAVGNWRQQSDSSWHWQIRQLRPISPANNLTIDSLWFERPVFQPGFNQTLVARIKNYGSELQSKVKADMTLNGQKVGFGTTDVPASASATVRIPFPIRSREAYAGQLSINNAGANFDDRLFFQFNTRQKAPVMIAGFDQNNLEWSGLFEDSLFQRSNYALANLDYQAIPSQDLTVLQLNQSVSSGLERSLEKSLANGGNIFLFPSAEAPQHLAALLSRWGLDVSDSYQESTLLSATIDLEDPYFDQVFIDTPENPDLPGVTRYLELPRAKGNALLTLANDRPLILRKSRLAGELFISAVPLDRQYSNLVNHPILNPILLNAALFQGQAPLPYLRAGKSNERLLFANMGPEPLKDQVVKASVVDQVYIPPQDIKGQQFSIGLPPEAVAPGNYPLLLERDTVGFLSINLDARESDLSYLSKEQLGQSKGLSFVEKDEHMLAAKQLDPQAAALWPWMIVAAIFSLLAEMILIKLWRP